MFPSSFESSLVMLIQCVKFRIILIIYTVIFITIVLLSFTVLPIAIGTALSSFSEVKFFQRKENHWCV